MSQPTQPTRRILTTRLVLECVINERDYLAKLAQPRDTWIAYQRHDDTPRPIAFASVWPVMKYLEWIEVSVTHRRCGYASELVRALQAEYPGLHSDAVTPDGMALEAALATEPQAATQD